MTVIRSMPAYENAGLYKWFRSFRKNLFSHLRAWRKAALSAFGRMGWFGKAATIAVSLLLGSQFLSRKSDHPATRYL